MSKALTLVPTNSGIFLFCQLVVIPDTKKKKGIWKDHIQSDSTLGIDVCPTTIKIMANAFAVSIYAILFLPILCIYGSVIKLFTPYKEK